MKSRALPYIKIILVVGFVIGLFFYTQFSVLAQTNNSPVGDNATEGAAAATAVGANPSNTYSPTQQAAATNGQIGSTNPGADGLTFVTEALYGAMTSIGGIITWAGGGLLDFALKELVVEMGDHLTGNVGLVVDQLWMTIRDIFNIVFIFVLIWIGLQTILRSDDSSVQKTLGGLIVAALLINFSLFITKSVVDFTNIAAYQIYQGFSQDQPDASLPDLVISRSQVQSISATFINSMKLSTFAAELKAGGSDWLVLSFGFMMMVVMVIAGFVFAAGAILMIVRFAALVAYMIFSPAMFLGLIYPKWAQYSSRWWNGFLSNAFVAPAYLFMLYLAAAIAVGIGSEGIGPNTFAGGFENDSFLTGNFAIFLYFAVIVAFLLLATRVASMMGAHGADMTMKVGNYGANKMRAWGKSIGMAPVNYSGRVARNAGAGISRNVGLGIPGTSYGIGGRFTKRSYDKLKAARNRKAQGIATAGDKTALAWHAMRGAGSLDDREADFEAALKHQPFGGKSRQQVADSKKQLEQRSASQKRINTITGDIASAVSGGTVNAVQARAAYNGVPGNQLVDIMKQGATQRKNIISTAGYLSDKQAEAVLNSDLDENIKQEFTKARKAQRLGIVRSSYQDPNRQNPNHAQHQNASELSNISSASRADLLTLGVNTLSQPAVAVRLSQKNIDNLADAQRENLITFEEYERVKNARSSAITNLAQGNTVANSTLTRNDLLRSAKNLGTYPDDALRALAPDFTPNDLQEILRSGKRGQIISDIRSTITTLANPTATQQATQNWLTTNAGQAFN